MRYRVWMYAVLVVILAAMVPFPASAEDVFAGQAVHQFQAPPQEAAVVPPISLTISGSSADVAQQAFLEYARAIGQPVEVRTYGGRFNVSLREETDSSRDAWGGIASELGNRATHGQIQLQADDRRVLTLRGEIREGERIRYVYSTAKTGMRVRVDASAWSQWANAWGGRSNDPQQRLRVEAVRDLVPLLMAELQQIMLDEARVMKAAGRKPGSVTTILELDGGTREFPGRVKQMDKIKLVRHGKVVDTIWCRNAYVGVDGTYRAQMAGDTTLAMEGDIILRR